MCRRIKACICGYIPISKWLGLRPVERVAEVGERIEILFVIETDIVIIG